MQQTTIQIPPYNPEHQGYPPQPTVAYTYNTQPQNNVINYDIPPPPTTYYPPQQPYPYSPNSQPTVMTMTVVDGPSETRHSHNNHRHTHQKYDFYFFGFNA
jgi:hypothetical protein